MKPRNVWKILMLFPLMLACESHPPGAPEGGTTEGQGENRNKTLPYFGNHDISLSREEDGTMTTDTLYFTVPPFAFINQNGREISDADYEGKIYVTDFFFTTCPTICPVMSSQLSRVQDQLRKKQVLGDVMLLSHTVDPENDKPEVLREYAERLGADSSVWNFVTGTQEDLYDQARHGYFLTALPSDTAAGGFFHSDTFVLIDRNKHIRGYYDGTSTQSVNEMLVDIEILLNQ